MVFNCIPARDFDPTLVNFSEVTKNKKGGNMVLISYGPHKQPLKIETPEFHLPFGLSSFKDEKSGVESLHVDASFKGMDHDTEKGKELKAFYEAMERFDQRVQEECVKESEKWMGKAMSKDIVTEFYSAMVKPPNDPKYSPNLKIKIKPRYNGDLPRAFDISDEDKLQCPELMELTDIKPHCTASFIVQVPFVWFVNKTFGCSLNMQQAAIQTLPPEQDNPDVFAFKHTKTPVAVKEETVAATFDEGFVVATQQEEDPIVDSQDAPKRQRKK